MIRIIDGVAYERKSGDSFNLKAYDCGNGHMEFAASRRFEWHELDWDADRIKMWQDYQDEYWADQAHQDDFEESKRLRSARRAKSNVRRLCKAMGADTLLTLTYRACVTDLAECKADLKEFVRRVRRVIPDFRAVAAFERQDRGAWHVHMATVRLPATLKRSDGVKVKSFPLLLAIWRSVTKDKGGSFNAKTRKRSSSRSPARIAAYLSKYILKAFEDGDKHTNRWTRFGDCEKPVVIDLGITYDLRGAIVDFYGLAGDDVSVVSAAISRWRDWCFVSFEPVQQLNL